MSRDLNDYVITECWRDVEQALPGETYILPIWQAWSTARNEVSALDKTMSIFVRIHKSNIQINNKCDYGQPLKLLPSFIRIHLSSQFPLSSFSDFI